MSVQQMALVWELNLPHNQAWVLMAYADHADQDGEHVFPSIGKIAWKTGYSARQVQRIVKDLEAKGLMELVRYRKGGRGVFPLYRLTLEKGVKKSPFKNRDISKKGDILSPKTPKRVTSCHKKGDIQMSTYPSLEPSSIQPSVRKTGRDRDTSKHHDNGHNHDEPPPTPEQQDEALGAVKGLIDGFLGRFAREEMPEVDDRAAIEQRRTEQIARAKQEGLL
jgi:hypothetical protein